MLSLQRIENQVSSLPEQELRKFRTWFDEFDAQGWDAVIASDINVGKLDSLAAEALADLRPSVIIETAEQALTVVARWTNLSFPRSITHPYTQVI